MTQIRISVRNTSETGGTVITPVFAGFHDNSFDVYDLGAAASAGLESLAEDGSTMLIGEELMAADADAQMVTIAGDRGPIGTGEITSTTLDVDGASNGYLGLASMVLPSNDAFIGTANAVQVFDEDGDFLGAQTITFSGTDVRDAGTEVNTELDAAFINQTAPNTGITEDGVVTVHPGFNGSAGNPVGEGDQIILGGTNAFGDEIDPIAADFTLPGAEIAQVHINTFVTYEGSDVGEFITGLADDDLITAGAGDDGIFTRGGWDEIDAGAGNDLVRAGSGADIVSGGADNDRISGGSDDDILSGDDGDDRVNGGSGQDLIRGGAGRDVLRGGEGDDTFVFVQGDELDVIRDFDTGDLIAVSVEGITTFDDIQHAASQSNAGVVINFGDSDAILLRGAQLDELSADSFTFA